MKYMNLDSDKYHDFDRGMGVQIKRELHAQGIYSYPAICDSCNGTATGSASKGETKTICDNCEGKGQYSLEV